jgi:heme O synthase-like polyprenyltransferase
VNVFNALICTLMIGVVLYQLASGKLLDKGWAVRTTREKRPLFYWSLLTLQAVIVAAVVFMILRDYRKR